MRSMPKSKTSSLRALLRAELGALPARPHRTVLLPKTMEEDTLLHYCPLIDEKCGLMECRGCVAIHNAISYDETWVCSECVGEGLKPHPYWTAGDCDNCGDYSSFLILVTDADTV